MTVDAITAGFEGQSSVSGLSAAARGFTLHRSRDETAGIEREWLCQAIKKNKKQTEWKAQGQDKRLHAGDSAVAFLHRGEWRLMVRMEMGVCMNASTAAFQNDETCWLRTFTLCRPFSAYSAGGLHLSVFSLGTLLTFNTWKNYQPASEYSPHNVSNISTMYSREKNCDGAGLKGASQQFF